MTSLAQRIALELGADGVAHPCTAALVIALRGQADLTIAEFAMRFGATKRDIGRFEAGDVAFVDLPATLRSAVSADGDELLFSIASERLR